MSDLQEQEEASREEEAARTLLRLPTPVSLVTTDFQFTKPIIEQLIDFYYIDIFCKKLKYKTFFIRRFRIRQSSMNLTSK